MSTNMNTSRKRVKRKCAERVSILDDDYRKKTRFKISWRKMTEIKHFGAPDNPFEASRKKYKQRTIIGKFICY